MIYKLDNAAAQSLQKLARCMMRPARGAVAAVAALLVVAGLTTLARRPPARRRVGRRLTVDESQADASRRFLSFILPSILGSIHQSVAAGAVVDFASDCQKLVGSAPRGLL